MKQKWSREWVSSKQVRKQRKYRYNAPLHVKHKFVSVNLSPQIRKQHGKRSIPVRKGDEVEIMRGGSKGSKGNVERVNLNRCKVYIEGINIKRADGSDVLKSFDPSNLRITKLKLDDKKRQKVFDRAKEAKKPKETAKKVEKKEAKRPVKKKKETVKKKRVKKPRRSKREKRKSVIKKVKAKPKTEKPETKK